MSAMKNKEITYLAISTTVILPILLGIGLHTYFYLDSGSVNACRVMAEQEFRQTISSELAREFVKNRSLTQRQMRNYFDPEYKADELQGHRGLGFCYDQLIGLGFYDDMLSQERYCAATVELGTPLPASC